MLACTDHWVLGEPDKLSPLKIWLHVLCNNNQVSMLYCMNRLKVFANLKSCFVISFSVFCIIPFLQQRELLLPHSMFGVLHGRFMQQNQEIIDHNWIETVKVSMPMCARYMTKYPRHSSSKQTWAIRILNV